MSSSSETSMCRVLARINGTIKTRGATNDAPYKKSNSPTWSTSERPDLTQNDLLDEPEIAAVRIPLHKLTQLEQIGSGAHAVVFKGLLNGKLVAIKRLSQEVTACGGGPRFLITEVHLVLPVRHPNLVGLIGVAWQPHCLETLRVVYEFMNRGDLRQLLMEFDQRGHAKSFDKQKLSIALDIAHGLNFLHTQQPNKVIHRDLKSRNILLNDQMQAKLTDFGISRYAAEDTVTMRAGIGTNLWMAPEVLMGEQYDEKADIFSFGVVLSELDTHLLPYVEAAREFERTHGRRLPEFALLQRMMSGELRVSFTNSAEQDPVVALALACVELEASKRPSATEVW